jgi:hypothetical protein
MAPVPSAEGLPVNWINYKTGEQHIAFKMDADNKRAVAGLVLGHPDDGMRELYFEQLLQLKSIFFSEAGDGWVFDGMNTVLFEREVSLVYKELEGYSVFKKDDWPNLISFFKSTVIRLDAFWATAKYAFEELR